MKQIFGVALLLSAVAAFAQDQTTQERVDVNLVLIDTNVTDRNGNAILGLTKEDFVVTENGVEQRIDSVDFFTSRRSIDAADENAKLRVERTREERYLVFFFQKSDEIDSSNMFTELNMARKAAKDFVDKQMVPTDRVAIVGHDVRLKVFSDFSSNKTLLKKAIDTAATFSRGERRTTADRGSASILANINQNRMMNETGRIYDALQLLAGSVQPIRARKTLIFFSPGIGEISTFNRNVVEPDSQRIDATIRALNDANVSVEAIRLFRGAGYSPLEDALSRMADETNGSYHRNLVRYETAIKQINRSHAGYYLLSYYTDRGRKPASGFQKVNVALRNSEFRVKARPGYAY